MDWLPEYLLMLGAGAAMAAILLLAIPGKVYGYMAVLPGLSPNWISIWRVPITIIGIFIFILAEGDLATLWIGYLIGAFGLLLDRVDGKVAKCVMQRLRALVYERMNHPRLGAVVTICKESKTAPLTRRGELWVWLKSNATVDGEGHNVFTPVLYEDWVVRLTKYHTVVPMFRVKQSQNRRYPGLIMTLTGMGEAIDPGADKAIFITLFGYLAWQNHLNTTVAVLMIISDLVSTVFRHPFDKMPVFKHLQRWVAEEKASPFGKTKVVWQILTTLVLLPDLAGWLAQEQKDISYIIASVILGLGVQSGIVSTLSRLTLWQRITKTFKWFRKFNRRFRRVFEHEIND